jgi:hypothetical protein
MAFRWRGMLFDEAFYRQGIKLSTGKNKLDISSSKYCNRGFSRNNFQEKQNEAYISAISDKKKAYPRVFGSYEDQGRKGSYQCSEIQGPGTAWRLTSGIPFRPVAVSGKGRYLTGHSRKNAWLISGLQCMYWKMNAAIPGWEWQSARNALQLLLRGISPNDSSGNCSGRIFRPSARWTWLYLPEGNSSQKILRNVSWL